jgi:CheY-like chemotaxis protein
MSHELRTPLNAILGFSQLLSTDPDIPAVQRGDLNIINHSGEHLLKLINDVLEMSKIEAGRIQLTDKVFDLATMVRNITDMMIVKADEKGLELLLDQSSCFPRYIVGDEPRMRQVLLNLIGNAIKFTYKGSVTVRLGTIGNKTSHLLIQVEDTGVGISVEDQQRIFEPFEQSTGHENNQGTGLGLSITRQFVQLMGGTVTLVSKPGEGSLFQINLPLSAEVSETGVANINKTRYEGTVCLEQGHPDYRILIVEDQLENQLLLSRLMQVLGLEIKIAENGKQAIEMFASWQPHLIWMDRKMPIMDGLEALKQIRKLPNGQGVKIIAVTASAFKEQQLELLGAGMDDFVSKPYRPDEIYDCLKKHLDLRFVSDGY